MGDAPRSGLSIAPEDAVTFGRLAGFFIVGLLMCWAILAIVFRGCL